MIDIFTFDLYDLWFLDSLVSGDYQCRWRASIFTHNKLHHPRIRHAAYIDQTKTDNPHNSTESPHVVTAENPHFTTTMEDDTSAMESSQASVEENPQEEEAVENPQTNTVRRIRQTELGDVVRKKGARVLHKNRRFKKETPDRSGRSFQIKVENVYDGCESYTEEDYLAEQYLDYRESGEQDSRMYT